jgi:hypothetical protein
MRLFGRDAEFEAIQRVLIEAHQRHPIRVLSYCVLLSKHWHFVVWPAADERNEFRSTKRCPTTGISWSGRRLMVRWSLLREQRKVKNAKCRPAGTGCLAALPPLA